MNNGWIETIEKMLEQHGVWGLAVATFLDSFISPIPPEVVFIPLSLATPEKAFWFAGLTTAISVIGAIVGYMLGLKGGRPLLCRLFSASKINRAENFIKTYGVAAVLLASFTPIPYKLITVSSGVFALSLKKLIFWSTLGRGARFFLEATLIMLFGAKAKEFLAGSSFFFLTFIVAFIVIIVYLGYIVYNRKMRNNKAF